jgi:hypothetical protein
VKEWMGMLTEMDVMQDGHEAGVLEENIGIKDRF